MLDSYDYNNNVSIVDDNDKIFEIIDTNIELRQILFYMVISVIYKIPYNDVLIDDKFNKYFQNLQELNMNMNEFVSTEPEIKKYGKFFLKLRKNINL